MLWSMEGTRRVHALCRQSQQRIRWAKRLDLFLIRAASQWRARTMARLTATTTVPTKPALSGAHVCMPISVVEARSAKRALLIREPHAGSGLLEGC